MTNILVESPIIHKPKIIVNKNNLIAECILQTVNEINRNKRLYSKDSLNEGISKISNRVKAGALLGELDHPLDREATRQVTVLYKEASHRIVDLSWNGKKLIGIVECLRTPNGSILRNLIEDGIPVGFSFRGMGDLREVNETDGNYYKVVPPVSVITWDSVSYPSHEGAQIVKILENYTGIDSKNSDDSVIIKLDRNKFIELVRNINTIYENSICDSNGDWVCTADGVCYLKKDFYKHLNRKKII